MQQLLNLPNELDYLFLLMIRISALIVSSPIFGRRNIPNIAKIGYCLLITLILYAAFPVQEPLEYRGMWDFILLCIMEFLFGVVMGYVVNAFFQLTFTAGHLIDMEMGFGMVNVFDAQTSVQIPITGNFLNLVMLICFFAVNGHLKLIYILEATLSNIPVGHVAITPALAVTALEVFAQTFLLAINVCMPVLAAGLLGEAAQGIMMRAVPSMNIFMVGIALKIVIGLFALFLILPVFVNFTNVLFDEMFIAIEQMFGGLAATI